MAAGCLFTPSFLRTALVLVLLNAAPALAAEGLTLTAAQKKISA